jgi:hypothetical protein
MKKCTKCLVEKLFSEFKQDKRRTGGLSSWCLECHNAAGKQYRLNNLEKAKEKEQQYRLNHPERIKKNSKQWRLNNPKKVLERARQYQLNHPARPIYIASKSAAKRRNHLSIADFMTRDEFEIWYNKQILVCAVCKTTENLCVDHNHETGKPRGILCNDCNLAEGKLKTIENVKALLNYMENQIILPETP